MKRLQRMSVGRPLYFENFERRICPAAVGFTEHVLAEDSIAGAIRSLIAADVDADGLTDIVAAGNDTYWYPNGGSDNFDHEIWISGYGGGLQVGDMDLDGDLDIFLGMTWHENVDGQGRNFQQAFEIRRGGAGTLADLDNDGDLDLVASRIEGRYSWGSMFWHENIDRLQVGVYGPAIHLWSGWDLGSGSFHVADLNQDGRNDVIFNNRGGGGYPCLGLGWFRGQGLVHEPFGSVQWVDGRPDIDVHHYCSSIDPAILDVDGDGDLDILFGHSDPTFWKEPGLFLSENNGRGRFALQHIPVELPGMPEKVLPADIDNDGDIDLVFSSSTPLGNGQVRNHGTFWLENMDGAGTFETVHDLAEVVELQDVADLDGDGDLDVIASRGSRILWYESDSAEDPDGDVDGNGVVDFADFLIISANFGRTDATPEEGDLNYDGTVNFADFLLLSRDFGKDFRPEVVFHLDFDGQIRDGSMQTLPLAVGPSVTPDAPGPILESGTQLSAGLWAGTNDDNNQILVFDHPILDEVSQSAGAIVMRSSPKLEPLRVREFIIWALLRKESLDGTETTRIGRDHLEASAGRS